MAASEVTSLPFRRKGYRRVDVPCFAEQHPPEVFIYVFQLGPFVKVGIARNPQERLKGLLSENPLDVRLAWATRVPTGCASLVEYEAHCSLRRYHHRNEWFRTSVGRACQAIGVGINVASGLTKPYAERASRNKIAVPE